MAKKKEFDYICPHSHPWVLGLNRKKCCVKEFATTDAGCDGKHME